MSWPNLILCLLQIALVAYSVQESKWVAAASCACGLITMLANAIISEIKAKK